LRITFCGKSTIYDYCCDLFRIFTVGDLAASNTILFTANLGLGFYVYFRHHLHRLNPWDRVEFRTPTWTRCLLGSALSVYLLSRAHKYLHYVDERSARKTPTPRSMRSPVVHLEKNGRPLPHAEGATVLPNGHDLTIDGDASSGYGTMRNGASLPVS
ncbi:hypothetical protein ANCDUO_03283, partial [Ancylostoma duodenale]